MALDYLHYTAGIVHRDIKPLNILLSDEDPNFRGWGFQAKLCDFGVSEKLHTPFELNDQLQKTAGTYQFFPPECCDPNVDSFSGMAADVWALGVTVFCLIFNRLPIWRDEFAENEFAILEFILHSEIEIPEDSERQVVEDEEE
jgi:[calcium/calmodulin-dependent protein kinase] kinase